MTALAALAMASVASAGQSGKWTADLNGGPNDPYTTNVPYLAWDGEQVRLVKCEDDVPRPGFLGITNNAKFLVEDWSGNPAILPQVETNTVTHFRGDGERSGLNCVSADIVSQKAGLAVVKLVDIEAETSNGSQATGDPVIKHQWLVIWMDLNNPVITEVNSDVFAPGDFNKAAPGFSPGQAPDALPAGGAVLGGGTGVFIPQKDEEKEKEFANGAIDVRVTGSFPLGNNFAGMADFPGDRVTLPDQWAALANNFAIDGHEDVADNGPGGGAATRWDIHDDQLATEGHDGGAAAQGCTPSPNGGVDAVDNCPDNPDGSNTAAEQDPFGEFSDLDGFVSEADAIGPFDPSNPLATQFRDGRLNAGDAPMPSARIDLKIAAGGAGTFDRVLKSDVYDRGAGTPHRWYAPFYATYLPATERNNEEASGIDGPRQGNNFPGFLEGGRGDFCPTPDRETECSFFNVPDKAYTYWRIAEDFTNDPNRGSEESEKFNDCKDESGDFRPVPNAPDQVAVYSDEHGEAIVGYNPDAEGFFLTVDDNGLCDLDQLPPNPGGVGRIIGTSRITAEAKYPYQPVFQPRKVSNELTKTVISLANKTLNCRQKTDLTHVVCWETILNIEGNPVEGVDVQFAAQGTGGSNLNNIIGFSRAFPNTTTPLFDTTGSDCNKPSDRVHAVTCDTVQDPVSGAGIAAFEFENTQPGCVDVSSENKGTRNGGFGVTRHVAVVFGPGGVARIVAGTCLTATTTTPPPPPPPPGGGTGGTPPGGTPPGGSPPAGNAGGGSAGSNPPAATPTVIVSVGQKTTPTAVKVKAVLVSAKIVVTKQGMRLMVRVNGPDATAKIRITLVGKNGKILRVVDRVVRTGKVVQVPNLKVAKAVKTVRVAVR